MITPGRYIQLVADSLAVQNARHLVVIIFAEVILRCTQYNVHTMELRVLRVGHEVWWVIIINVIIVIPTQKGSNIEGCAHC